MSVYKWKTEDEARKHVKVYEDNYEDLINDANVEAVIIALPLWLHDVAAFKAMRAGKHVLSEKLMAQTIGRCKEMGRLQEESKAKSGDPIVLAVGHQRHYSILYANAVDQIKRGLLGDLHHIRASGTGRTCRATTVGRRRCPAMMTPEEFTALERKTKAAGGDAARVELRDQYRIAAGASRDAKAARGAEEGQGLEGHRRGRGEDRRQERSSSRTSMSNAAKYGYVSQDAADRPRATALEELIRWRLWDRTAAGLMAELGSHQLDASSIFISSQRDDGGKVYPLSVQGIGFRSLFPADRDVDDHVHCNFEFPGGGYYEDITKQDKVADPHKKIVVTYSSINGNGFGGYGECVMGTKGTLILEREQEAMLFAGDAAHEDRSERRQGGKAGDDHLRNGRRGRGRPGGHAEERQPRLQRRNRALGVVHPQPRPRQPAALHAEGGDGRRDHRADVQHRDEASGGESSSTTSGSTFTTTRRRKWTWRFKARRGPRKTSELA